jgi:DNA polymerase-1
MMTARAPIAEITPKRLYLIDGSGFIFRAYHSLPPLTRPDGTPVGAVYGFVNMILKLIEGVKADYLAVIFDAARETFRNRMYENYKANRPPLPEDLAPQFPIIREAVTALNIPALEKQDYEADDLIATYTRLAREQGMEVIIVSSDKDLMQLIGEGVEMFDPMKLKRISRAEVEEKFGVGPEKVLDVLSLIGDSSDNVPGVPGIGPKTAAELIGAYGDLDQLLEQAGTIKQPKRRETLTQFADQARLSRDLIRLCDTVPLDAPLESLSITPPQGEQLIPFLKAQGFKSLVTRYEEKFGIRAADLPAYTSPDTVISGEGQEAVSPAAVAASIVANYELVKDAAALERWLAEAERQGFAAFDTETDSLDATRARLVGFSLATAPGRACYVPLEHVETVMQGASQASLFGEGEGAATSQRRRLTNQLQWKDIAARMTAFLENPSVLKIGHNLKYDAVVLNGVNIRITPLADTMLMSYVLNAGRHNHGMDELAERYLSHTTISYHEVTGTGKKQICFSEVALDKALAYAAEDADITLRLYQYFQPLLVKEGLVSVYETFERPLVPVIAAIESAGIRIDTQVLATLSQDFSTRMQGLEEVIYGLVGHPFNIGSPKQLGEVLFEELGLKTGKKTSKSGSYSTGAEVLEELAAEGHEVPARVMEWRQLSKLKGTYTDALVRQMHPDTGRVHTSYSMAATTTGRLSSSEPNLQNIPIRTSDGRKIRDAFVAAPGHKLISADYSQIELRLLAHVAEIDILRQAFRDGKDIHAITAHQMFGVPVDQVTSDLRRKAKTINFGIIYGISAHGLATGLGISRGEAADYIRAYFRQYPGIEAYMERTKAFAREHGYVTTLYGRRCHITGINDKNPNMRAFSERAAINAPLQGSAADIIKRAMIALHRKLTEGGFATRMLLQVHDELVLEAPEKEADTVLPLIRQEMEQAARLSLPLTVEAGVGTHWGEIH